MEEITLSVPGSFENDVRRQPLPLRDGERPVPAHAAWDLEKLARSYLQAARARDRFALTARGRQRRLDRFNMALKRLTKSLAAQGADAVQDRRARAEVRARIYAQTLVLARVTGQDYLRTVRRARRTMRWGLLTAGIGLTGVAFTLVANGWLPFGAP